MCCPDKVGTVRDRTGNQLTAHGLGGRLREVFITPATARYGCLGVIDVGVRCCVPILGPVNRSYHNIVWLQGQASNLPSRG